MVGCLKNLWVRRQNWTNDNHCYFKLQVLQKYIKKLVELFILIYYWVTYSRLFLFSLCVVNWQKLPHNHPSKYVGILLFFCSHSIYSNKLFLCGIFCVLVLFLRSLWHLLDEEWTCWIVNFFIFLCLATFFIQKVNLCLSLIFLIIGSKLWLNFLWGRWLEVLVNWFISNL